MEKEPIIVPEKRRTGRNVTGGMPKRELSPELKTAVHDDIVERIIDGLVGLHAGHLPAKMERGFHDMIKGALNDCRYYHFDPVEVLTEAQDMLCNPKE